MITRHEAAVCVQRDWYHKNATCKLSHGVGSFQSLVAIKTVIRQCENFKFAIYISTAFESRFQPACLRVVF